MLIKYVWLEWFEVEWMLGIITFKFSANSSCTILAILDHIIQKIFSCLEKYIYVVESLAYNNKFIF